MVMSLFTAEPLVRGGGLRGLEASKADAVVHRQRRRYRAGLGLGGRPARHIAGRCFVVAVASLIVISRSLECPAYSSSL